GPEGTLRGDGGAHVRARQGRQLRHLLRDRRRDRPGRVATLDHDRAPLGAPARPAEREEAPLRRYVVSYSPSEASHSTSGTTRFVWVTSHSTSARDTSSFRGRSGKVMMSPFRLSSSARGWSGSTP